MDSALYDTFIQPAFAPPAWIYDPVWIVLHVIIAATAALTLYYIYAGKLPQYLLVPLGINIIAKLSFSPLVFNFGFLWFGAVDVFIVFLSLAWLMWGYWFSSMRWLAYVQIPYLLWISFALVLQLAVAWLNRPLF